MPVQFRCVHCHTLIKVAEKLCGKAIRCPSCRETIHVPAQAPPSTPSAKGTTSAKGMNGDEITDKGPQRTSPGSRPARTESGVERKRTVSAPRRRTSDNDDERPRSRGIKSRKAGAAEDSEDRPLPRSRREPAATSSARWIAIVAMVLVVVAGGGGAVWLTWPQPGPQSADADSQKPAQANDVAKKPAELERDIVGVWQLSKGDRGKFSELILECTAAKAVKVWVVDHTISVFEGSYTLEADKLTITFQSAESDIIARDRIKKLTASELVLEDEQGKTEEYQRITREAAEVLAKKAADASRVQQIADASGKVNDAEGKADETPGKERYRRKAHKDAVHQVLLSHDGRKMASVGYDDAIHVWEAATGRKLHSWSTTRSQAQEAAGRSVLLTAVAFSADDRRLAVGRAVDSATRVVVIDVVERKQLLQFDSKLHSIGALVFSVDGKMLAVFGNGAGFVPTIELHECATGKLMKHFIPFPEKSKPARIGSMEFSANGKTLLVRQPTWASNASLIDLETGKVFFKDTVAGKDLDRVLVAPDGKTLVLPAVMEQKSLPVESLALWHSLLSRDGRKFFTVGVNAPDGTPQPVRMWDVDTGRQLASLSLGTITCVTASSDNRMLIAGLQDGNIRVWNLEGFGELAVETRIDESPGKLRYEHVGHATSVEKIVFSHDSRKLVSIAFREVQLWDVATGKKLEYWPTKAGVPTAAFSFDDGRLAVGDGGEVFVWDMKQRKEIVRFPTQADQAMGLAFSSDGKTLASVIGNPNGQIALWESATGKRITSFGAISTREGISALAFSADEKTLLVASGGSSVSAVSLWNVATGNAIVRHEIRRKYLDRLAIAPDGQTVIATTGDSSDVWKWSEKLIKHVWGEPGKRRTEPSQDPDPSLKYLPVEVDRNLKRILLSADGKKLFTVTGRGGTTDTVTIWDTTAAKKLGTPRIGSTSSLALSPDERLLAIGSEDGNVLVWNLENRDETVKKDEEAVRKLAVEAAIKKDAEVVAKKLADDSLARGSTKDALRGHHGGCPGLAFSPDGRTLASASTDGTIRFWDLSNGATVQLLGAQMLEDEIRPSDRQFDGAVAFSPDGKTLASGARGVVQFWDIATGKSLAASQVHGKEVNVVTFSPNGKILVSTGIDQKLLIWDVSTGRKIDSLESTSGITAAAISPDGKLLATTGPKEINASPTLPGEVALWDLATKKKLAVLQGHNAAGTAVVFSPDGKWLASADHRGTVKIWDIESAKEAATFAGHKRSVGSLAFSPDSMVLVTGCSDDMSARLWDVRAAKIITLLQQTDFVSCVAVGPESNPVLAISLGGTRPYIRLMPLAAAIEAPKKKVRTAPPPSPDSTKEKLVGHSGRCLGLAFSPDGRSLASSSHDGTVRLWDLGNGQTIQIMAPEPEKNSSWMKAVAFSPDGKRIVSGGEAGTLHLWDTATGENVADWQNPKGSAGAVHFVSFSPDGQLVLSAGRPGRQSGRQSQISSWDAETGKMIAGKTSTSALNAAAFRADGKVVAFSCFTLGKKDNPSEVFLWDVASKKTEVLQKDTSPVTALAFSPDGKWLASADGNGTLTIWDADNRQKVATLTGHTRIVGSLAFSFDSKVLASGSEDKTVRLWDVNAGKLITTLEQSGPVACLAFGPKGNPSLAVSLTSESFVSVRLLEKLTDPKK